MATMLSIASPTSLCLSSPSLVNLRTSGRSRMKNGRVLGSSPIRRIPGLKVNASLAGQRNGTNQNFGRGFFLMLESLVGRFKQMGEKLGNAVPKFEPHTAEEMQLLAALKGRLVCAAAPVFFAAISQSAPVNTPLTVVASGMAKWLELYSGVLMVRVLLSWFPNIPWERQPLQAMRDMCDPYLNLFRNIIPPLFNALDLSPMLAFLVLGVLTSILNTTVQSGVFVHKARPVHFRT
ncbi:hypothetical protein R1sor_009602 [Riccia sorocarpa]|uniref:Uncharacterized protein n=1 Tax=Riccia sorocarpa TaxID=122646 RepID=A0ABD3HXE3_9MARC